MDLSSASTTLRLTTSDHFILHHPSSPRLTTGVNKLAEFESEDAKIQPQFYVESLGDLRVLAEKQ